MMTRRTALQIMSTTATTIALAPTRLAADPQVNGAYPHQLPSLPYAPEALEPHIDTRTMEIHHGRHHKTYVDKLNEALANYPELQKKSLEELIRGWEQAPEKIRSAVRNHGGGHFNHSLFWKCLTPAGTGGNPSDAIKEAFGALGGSAEEVQETFLKLATGVFGSGWAWVTVSKTGKLKFETTANQDVPFGPDKSPLIGLDVWEHAYYLKYQNRRADYVKAFLNVVNWNFVNARYSQLTQ